MIQGRQQVVWRFMLPVCGMLKNASKVTVMVPFKEAVEVTTAATVRAKVPLSFVIVLVLHLSVSERG
jgi:hypothetical protein